MKAFKVTRKIGQEIKVLSIYAPSAPEAGRLADKYAADANKREGR